MTKKVSAAEPEEMKAMIAKTAYYKAEQRGFVPGFEEEDWLAAESEVRAITAGKPKTLAKPDSDKADPKAKATMTGRKSTGRTRKKPI